MRFQKHFKLPTILLLRGRGYKNLMTHECTTQVYDEQLQAMTALQENICDVYRASEVVVIGSCCILQVACRLDAEG